MVSAFSKITTLPPRTNIVKPATSPARPLPMIMASDCSTFEVEVVEVVFFSM
jgi:hypothetical protein